MPDSGESGYVMNAITTQTREHALGSGATATCPVCGSSAVSRIATSRDTLEVWRCRGCRVDFARYLQTEDREGQPPDHFRNLASESGMTVQLTPLSGESMGLTVIRKRLDGIVVMELDGGVGNYEFDWRVEAVRKGWEDYKVIRPWRQSDEDRDKAWQIRLKWFDECRVQGKPSPDTCTATPRP